MRIVRLSSLLLVLLLCLPVLGQVQISIRRAAAVGGGAWSTPVTDNFNRSDGANLGSTTWTETVGDPSISTNQVFSNASNYVALWDDNALAAKQCSCVMNTTTVGFCGPVVRFDSLSTTTVGYIARMETTQVPVRFCTDASCTTIENWTNVINDGNWLCLCVDGEDSATEFALWERASDPSAEDPTDWGNADVCVCDDTTCSLWDCTATQAWDTTPTYRNCSGDACYAGIYSGSSGTDCLMDNWSARDFQ